MPWPYLCLTFITLCLNRSGYTVAATISAACCSLFLYFDLKRAPRRLYAGIVLGFMLGFWLFMLRSSALTPEAVLPTQGTARVTGVSRKSVIVETAERQRLRLMGFKGRALPQKHDLVKYSCEVRPIPESTFAVFERLSGTRAWCQVTSLQIQDSAKGPVVKIRQRILQFLEHKFAALGKDSLIAAFLLGDTDDLSARELAAFRDMGLMHLFAVSGLNIALLFALLYLPFRALKLKVVGAALGYLVATAFLVLLDFPVPLLRAWLFMTIAVAMRLLDRRITSWTLLFLTAVIVEIWFPLSTFSMSFILSFGVTAAILVFYEPLRFCFRATHRLGNLVAAHVALSLAAGLPAMLLTWLLFGNANPVALLYNLLLVPFSGLYLFSALVFLFADFARYAILALDQVYLGMATLHSDYIMRLFPAAEPVSRVVSFVLVAALLAALVILQYRRRLWSARRNLRFVVPAAAFALLLPYALVKYPARAFYALPNQVFIYKERKLDILGKRLFADASASEPVLCFPVTAKTEHSAATNERAPDLIIQDKNCFVFTGGMKPELWRATALAACSELNVLQSSKSKTSAAEWRPLFTAFGYGGEVKIRRYFTWYGDRVGNCIKENL